MIATSVPYPGRRALVIRFGLDTEASLGREIVGDDITKLPLLPARAADMGNNGLCQPGSGSAEYRRI